MKNLYQKLKPKIKKQLNSNCKKYESVNRIKYTLMSKSLWQELSITDLKDLILWTDIDTRSITINGMLYGENIINND